MLSYIYFLFIDRAMLNFVKGSQVFAFEILNYLNWVCVFFGGFFNEVENISFMYKIILHAIFLYLFFSAPFEFQMTCIIYMYDHF